MEQFKVLYHLQQEDRFLSSQVVVLALRRSLVDSSMVCNQRSTMGNNRDCRPRNLVDNNRHHHPRSLVDNNRYHHPRSLPGNSRVHRLFRGEQLHTYSQIAMLDRILHLLLLVLLLRHTVHREPRECMTSLNKEGTLHSSNNHRLLRPRSSVSIRLRYHDR